MANALQFSKYGNKWEKNKLVAFNIQVVEADLSAFFGTASLPELTSVSPAILNNLRVPDYFYSSLSNAETEFFAYMEDAKEIRREDESFVEDFVVFIMKMMGYERGHRIIHTRHEMRFEMRGIWSLPRRTSV